MPKITAIPATKPLHSVSHALPNIRRVAGYARVSTDDEDQANSYAAQVDYYEHYIRSHDGWKYAGIYTDEGISGISTKHRDGFNQMVTDALSGKIDLIVTPLIPSPPSERSRIRVWRCSSKKKTSGHSIQKANSSSPSCPASLKKNHALLVRM